MLVCLIPCFTGQVQESVDISCAAAGFTQCCFVGRCQLESGCSCDRACYTRGDCCTDISSLCPGVLIVLTSSVEYIDLLNSRHNYSAVIN